MSGIPERARMQREEYSTYVRLRWLLEELPSNHPARPHLQMATNAADRHWRCQPTVVGQLGQDLILDDGPLVRRFTAADLA